MSSSARKKASPLWGEALKRVAALPIERQDAIASQILETLNNEPDPANVRFHELIDKKFARGLSASEKAELEQLEAGFQQQDEEFYAPILERVTALVNAQNAGPAKRRTAAKSK